MTRAGGSPGGEKCDRFEREGLLRLEEGLPLDEHFARCPDCLRARAAYERLEQELAALGAENRPPAGWQARVWAAVEARRRSRQRRRWFRPWLLAPASAAAALLAAFLLWQGPTASRAPELAVAVQPGEGPVRRGGEARPGDHLVLDAATGGARHAELRVYRNDRDLLLRCSSEPPCARRRGHLRAAITLDALGAYQSLLLLSEVPLPPPAAGATLDEAAGAALAAGARIELGEEVHVR